MFDAGAIVGRLTLNLNQWTGAVQKVKQDNKSLQGFILRNEQQVKNLGRGFVILGAAVLGSYALMTKGAITFESAFAGVRKTVDATEEEFAQLRLELVNMSNRMPMSAAALAGIQEIAGQLGVRGVGNLTKFTETIAKIAVTTNLTKEAAATDFARIANIMREPLNNVDRMGAAVVDLGNNFATTEAEISAFGQRIAGAGKVVGITTADVFGIGAAFTSVGVRAERGGTAVSKALVKIGESIKTGNKDLEVFARVSGMTSEQFVEAFEENAGKAFAIFIEGLGKGGLEAAQILEELELGDQRLKQAFLSVGGASGIMTEAIKMSSEAWRKNTALTEEAEKRFATTASRLKILWNTVVNLGVKIGELLFPMINNASMAIARVVRSMQEWVDNNKVLAVTLAKAGLAVGVLSLALGSILLVLPGLIVGMIAFKAATAGAAVTVLGLEIALGPAILAVIALLAVLVAVPIAIYKWNHIKAFMWSLAEGVNYALAEMIESLANWVDKIAKIPIIGKPFRGLVNGMRREVDEFRQTAEYCAKQVEEAFKNIDSAAGDSKVKEIVDNIAQAIKDMTQGINSGDNDFAKIWQDELRKVVNNLSDWSAMVGGIVQQTASGMQEVFSDLFFNFRDYLDGSKNFFVEWGNFVIKIISDVIARILTAKIIGAAMGLFSAGVGAGASSTSSTILPAYQPLSTGFATGIESVPETGIYKLHQGEKVVPAYDATKNGAIEVTIQNLITSEAVAMAMSGREGKGVIVNVINENSMRYGVIKKETVRR